MTSQPSHRIDDATAEPDVAATPRTYTVVRGDDLRRIARRLFGTMDVWPRLFEANRHQLADPLALQPGQKLVVPEP